MSILKNIIIFLLLALAAIQIGCKGKQGDPGPIGPNDPDAGLFTNGSYIKGTVTTIQADSIPVTFAFNHTYLIYNNTYEGSGNTSTFLMLKDFKGNAGTPYKMSQVMIDMDSISDINPANPQFVLFDDVALASNQHFIFMVSGAIALTNYQYDDATNTVSSDYTITSSATNNGKSAVVNGSFKFVGLSENVYRQAVK
jgi:hypothetical protein